MADKNHNLAPPGEGRQIIRPSHRHKIVAARKVLGVLQVESAHLVGEITDRCCVAVMKVLLLWRIRGVEGRWENEREMCFRQSWDRAACPSVLVAVLSHDVYALNRHQSYRDVCRLDVGRTAFSPHT